MRNALLLLLVLLGAGCPRSHLAADWGEDASPFDGALDPGEAASDAGCLDPSCERDLWLVVTNLALGGRGDGCDYSGNGQLQNAIGGSLGLVSGFAGEFLAFDQLGDRQVLLRLDGLEGAGGDQRLAVGWHTGAVVGGAPAADSTGAGEYRLDGPVPGPSDPSPVRFEGTLTSGLLDAELSAGDIELDDAALPLPLADTRMRGRLVDGDTSDARLTDGVLCGGVPVAASAFVPNPIGATGEPLRVDLPGLGSVAVGGPPCDGGDTATLADVLVGGLPVGSLFRIFGVGPDIDLDGDGLERFEVLRTGTSGCQPVITACIDGDGTRLEGRDCPRDPRFQDALSVGFTLEAVRATVSAP